MPTETESFVLEVPLLENAAVDALHTFLLDLLTQFENHYFAQLHRHQHHQASLRRAAIEDRQAREGADPIESADEWDDEFNDDIPF
jgi:hypothetical protein